jgi:hypothetical protein
MLFLALNTILLKRQLVNIGVVDKLSGNTKRFETNVQRGGFRVSGLVKIE